MQPVLPSQAPHPLTRNKKIIICTLVTLVLVLVLLAGIYWKNHTGPYLKEHPLAWQVGLAVIGVVALILGCLYYQRHKAKSSQTTETTVVTAVATSSPAPIPTAAAASATPPVLSSTSAPLMEKCGIWFRKYMPNHGGGFIYFSQGPPNRMWSNYPPEGTYWSDPDHSRWGVVQRWDEARKCLINEYSRK